MVGVAENMIAGFGVNIFSRAITAIEKRYRLPFNIRQAIANSEETIENHDIILESITRAFGSLGILDKATNDALIDISESGIFEYILIIYGTKTNTEYADRLIEYIFLSRGGDPKDSGLFSKNISIALTKSFHLLTKQYDMYLSRLEIVDRDKKRIFDAKGSASVIYSIIESLQDDRGGWIQGTNFNPLVVRKKIIEFVDPLQIYSKQISIQLNSVDVHGSSGEVVKVDLDKIYVDVPVNHISREGNFQKYQDLRNGQPRERIANTWSDVFGLIRHTVLLGDPGGGKSTLSKKICLETARRFTGDSTTLPVFVELRRYIARLVEFGPISFGNYILEEIKSRNIGPHDDTIDVAILYHLRIGAAFIVADGLDEVLTPANRAKVVEEIRAFSKSFPLVNLLVTSRYVGYETQPLNGFEHIGVGKLSPLAISDIYTNVSRIVLQKDDDDIESSRDNFFRDANSKASELISSPLLLTLIVIIYSKKSEIPDNRANLYASCADLLFDRWDAYRSIKPKLPERYRLFDLFKQLAYILYEQVEYGGRISKDNLTKEARAFFRHDYVDNREGRSAESAKLMVDHLTGRAWILHEVGEDIFEFTHRTFLEFFYARFLETSFESTEELVSQCLNYISTGTRTVPAHLALQIRTKDKRHAATIVAANISNFLETNSKNIEVINFAIESLDYLLPNADILFQLSDKIAKSSFEYGNSIQADRFLCTHSPMRATILQGSLEVFKSVDTMKTIRKLSPALRRLKNEKRDEFELDNGEIVNIGYVLSKKNYGKQMSSPNLAKLAFDLDQNIHWRAIERFNFGIWGRNDFDLRMMLQDSREMLGSICNWISGTESQTNKYLRLARILTTFAIDFSNSKKFPRYLMGYYLDPSENNQHQDISIPRRILNECPTLDLEVLSFCMAFELEMNFIMLRNHDHTQHRDFANDLHSVLKERNSNFYEWFTNWRRNEISLVLSRELIRDIFGVDKSEEIDLFSLPDNTTTT